MTPFKKKALTFTFGLLFGIVIAGAFFILRLDNYFKELNFYKDFTKNYLFHQPTPTIEPTTDRQLPLTKATDKKQNKSEITHTEKNESFVDSLNVNVNVNDSTPIKTPMVPDDIVIRKDELLGIKTLVLSNLNPLFHKTSRDSLLEKVSDVKDDRQMMKKQLMNVEFWKSPLNFKGYKLSKNNVILYGLTDTQNISIYMIENTIYMRNASIVYKLEYSNYFKPFDHIVEDPFSNNTLNK